MSDLLSAPVSDPPRDRSGLARAAIFFKRGLHRGLGLGGMALILATFLPLLHPFWPLAAVAEHFALQILMGAAALGILALVLRRWRWLGMVAAIALIQLWTIHPYWPGFVTGHKAALASSTGLKVGEMKVVSLNVWYRGDSYEVVRRYLQESNADVIGLVEVTPRWKEELAPLQALYPHRVDCIGDDQRCEEMLLSKHPFLRSGASRIDGTLPVLAWGEVAPRGGGKPVTFAVTHVIVPLKSAAPAELAANPLARSLPNGLPRIAQAEQVQILVDGIRDLGPDLVLMGDFNAAPWSRIQQSLRELTGLDNQGFLAQSWPSWGPTLIRLPIDHILTRGTPRLISFQPGPDVGSDHLPVEATLSFAQP